MSRFVSNKIKILNLLFTIGIVTYHFRWAFDLQIKNTSAFDGKIVSVFLSMCDKLGYLSMVFFFILSGFLFYYNINRPSEAVLKMKKRLKTLLVPYLVWFLIVSFYMLINGDYKIVLYMDFLEKIFLSPIDGPMWYCLALLLLMIPSPLIVKLKNKKLMSTILLLISIILLNLRFFGVIKPLLSFTKWWWYGNMIMYLQSYIIGVYLSLLFSNHVLKMEHSKKSNIYVHRLLPLLLIMICAYLSLKINVWSIKELLYIGVVIGIWLFFDFKFLMNDIKVPQISFILFAMHQPILIPEINRLLDYIIGSKAISGVEFILIKIIGVILMGLICYFIVWLLNRVKGKKILSYLSGGRA